MANIVSMSNVSKLYDGFSLSNVSFQIPKGYIMGLIGPNGAGKTTLIKLMMNLAHPSSGDIDVFGNPYHGHEKEIKSRIGFVYDEPGLYQDETIKRMKSMIAPFYASWDETQFQTYMDYFQLPQRKKIKKLSKGMKMKFSLALALSHDADFIVLDEPTAGLDPVFRRELLEIFADIMQDENKTILLSSHITTDLDRIADFITYIDNGQIVFSRPKDDIFETYGVVKGPNSMMDESFRKCLIGTRQTAVGFEALTDQVSDVEALAGDGGLVIEPASLEDILYYHSKERNPWST